MDFENANFAEIIKELQSLGITQTEIAKKIGVTQGTISQVKTGLHGFGFQRGLRLFKLYKEVIEKKGKSL
ncbi:MAG: helix-turn-helix transcriptional regulator [Neisseriaceae bacterium]|nr:helix-turn-helix transcriptional regulator [Neisseriaceae bacterium]MBR1819257.1 helix-turn-helix transcriptional regulator [Neisseriaceae bacterium]